jgi:DNA-directed RNA polymerase specialized sigma24 family protein
VRRPRPSITGSPSAPAPADPAEDGLIALLDGLPPRQRAALTLRYVFDLSDEAIAAALRCRPATVRSHLFHGRAAVERRLDSGSQNDA